VLACLAALAPCVASAACSVSTLGLNFGSYDVFSPLATDITGSISVQCDSSTSYTITADTGSGTYLQRTLQNGMNGMNVLYYNLYIDTNRLAILGDGSSGTSTITATNVSATHTVYGRIPPRQNVVVGTYNDTITVTLTF
jgi:spore coat protein U-like protein